MNFDKKIVAMGLGVMAVPDVNDEDGAALTEVLKKWIINFCVLCPKIQNYAAGPSKNTGQKIIAACCYWVKFSINHKGNST
jgi:hypothetical protein